MAVEVSEVWDGTNIKFYGNDYLSAVVDSTTGELTVKRRPDSPTLLQTQAWAQAIRNAAICAANCFAEVEAEQAKALLGESLTQEQAEALQALGVTIE